MIVIAGRVMPHYVHDPVLFSHISCHISHLQHYAQMFAEQSTALCFMLLGKLGTGNRQSLISGVLLRFELR